MEKTRLYPKEQIVNNFLKMVYDDSKCYAKNFISMLLSFYIRKNTFSETTKIKLIENFLKNSRSYIKKFIRELIESTVDTNYPNYIKNGNLLEINVIINNILKENIKKTIIYAIFNLSKECGLTRYGGDDMIKLLTTDTENQFIINVPYNGDPSDPNPDMILVDVVNSNVLYKISHNGNEEIITFSTEPIKQWAWVTDENKL